MPNEAGILMFCGRQHPLAKSVRRITKLAALNYTLNFTVDDE